MVLRSSKSPLTPEFDAFVQQRMDKWRVPGLTMAIVHGSSTWSKAYGIAEFPDRRMTTDCLFSTCSTTKAFTAAAVSLVIDDSKYTDTPLSWDTPIVSILRDDFVLENDYSTTNTTLEDALSHRSGLSTHDASIALANPLRSLRDAVRSLRYLKMAYAPRTNFSYNNNMYIVISHALEQIEHRSLGEILKSRIWDPLEMTDTYFSAQEVSQDPSLATRFVRGYTWDSDSSEYILEEYMNDRAITGAGAIVSSVLDYTKWLRALIYKTAPLSPQAHAELVKPRTVIPSWDEGDLVTPPAPHHLYALGWFVASYRDQPFYWHSGSWAGFGIMIGFLPSLGFGFVMMGNTMNARNAQVEIYMRLLDGIFGDVSGVSHAAPEIKPSETLEEAVRRLYPCLPSPVLMHALPVQSYAGRYAHPAFGTIVVSFENGLLCANLLDRVVRALLCLRHASGEFFVAHYYQPTTVGSASEYYRTEFLIGVNGVVSAMGMDLEPATGEKIWFDRLSN